MKEIKQDRLGILFAEMKTESPSAHFEQTLMAKIASGARRKARLQWCYMLLVPGTGIAAIITALWLIDKFTDGGIGFQRPDISFEFPSGFSLYLIPTILVLLLLIADTLIRRHLNRKRIDPTPE